jgi:3-phosphoshikimate 1-carboxyvinyltransferase
MKLGRRSVPVLRGTVAMPGDKSVSHRALIFAALASGRSTVSGINAGADVRATARMLGQLGAPSTFAVDNHKVQVEGKGWNGLHEPEEPMDAGNSGTSMRLLLAVCAGIDGASVLTGDDSLRRRPMLRVVAPLRQMGARIDGRSYGDRAPLFVRGGELAGLDYESTVASAQVKTAVLLAGLRASGTTSVREPGGSRDHTERMLAAAGVAVERRNDVTVAVTGGAEIRPMDWVVPGDVSAAMFFVVAALILPGSDITIASVGLNPTRMAAFDVLDRMGARIEVEVKQERSGETTGDVRVRHSELTGTEVVPEEIPALIDEIPALSIAATQAHGPTVIRGATELRVKESDRVSALAGGLAALGAEVEELEDGLIIRGSARLTGGEVQSYGDHRIAMAFAVAGLAAPDRVRVRDWSCVETSFPGFLEVLDGVREPS